MCYFKTLGSTRDEVARLVQGGAWGVVLDGDMPEEMEPDWRESIGKKLPIMVPVEGSADKVRFIMAHWGVLMDPPTDLNLANARSDKLHGWPWTHCSPCGVPSDGFYEPEKPRGSKADAPWSYYQMHGGQTFVMAGVWREGVHARTGEMMASFAVVTVEANETVAKRKHNRMPAILRDEDVHPWLFTQPYAMHLIKSYSAEEMSGWRVSDDTKSGKAPNTADMIRPVPEDDGPPQGTLF